MESPIGGRLSRIVCICCFIVLGFTSFVYYPRWNKSGGEATISWDVSGYYWYLPSIFIYKDLKHQGFKDSIFAKYHPSSDFQQAVPLPDGNYAMKYASGMAVMYLPSFMVGHATAGVLGYPQDGFSKPYQLSLQLCAFLVCLLGIWHLRKLLLLYYSDKVTAWTIALLVLGTNYLNTAGIDVGMSHGWLFTVYVFLLLNTVYFYRSFQTKYAVRIGLLTGLATLTRPTDALSLLIPLLWGMESVSPAAIKERVLLIARHYRALLLAVVCAAMVVSVQLIYWKYATGHWIFYSYQDQHLYFRSPNIWNYTFSYRSGWLRYSPMLLLAFAGLIPFWLKGKNKVAITAFFLLNYYFVCSWSIWWFGGRAMVQSYPVLLFPLAALVDAAFSRKLLFWVLAPCVLVFTYLNIWFTYQSHTGGLYDIDTMNEAFYKRVIGRWHVPDATVVLRDNTELYEGQPQHVQVIYQNDFEADTSIHNNATPIRGRRSLLLDSSTRETIEYKFPYPAKAGWLRMSADMHCDEREYNIWKMAQIVGRLYKNGQKQKENMFRIYRILDNGQTRTITLDIKVSGAADTASIGFWNGYGNKRLIIDNIRVVSFDE